jgi:hypothetical protein
VRQKTATLMLVAVMVGSTAQLPATPGEQGGATGTKQTPSATPATHAVRGVVKSVGPKSLVITRSSKKPSDLAFVLTPSTLRAGTIVTGAVVSVRYRTEDKVLVATAVTVDPARGQQ